jgi:sugar phosphate isomerase/epimerase
MMNRREALFSIAGGFLTPVLANPARALSSMKSGRTQLGIANFSYNIRLKAERSGHAKSRLEDPLNFLAHCHKVGAGGIQTNLGIKDKVYIRKLRENAKKYGMFIEGSTGLPRNQSDIEKFEATILTAKQAGVKVIRVAIGGRRYEQFDKAEQFKTFAERSFKSLQIAEPIAARHRMRLAIENHKDWRIPEMLNILKKLSSEYIGVCIDTGNSFALLEDPMVTVQKYAPWGFSVHLKDMAVCEYEDGFLLADVPLGEGLLDLSRMIQILRKARDDIRFSLEMATRDALKVPCLTEKYWATFTEIPGSDLARTLRYVRTNTTPEKSLPHISQLSLDEQLKLEEDNIRKSLVFARDHLSL